MRISRLNCWEVKSCGRESGGREAERLGVCPAATVAWHDGTNGGRNAGRYCWRVAGTHCDGEVQGKFAEKALACSKCEFFLRVVDEEGQAITL